MKISILHLSDLHRDPHHPVSNDALLNSPENSGAPRGQRLSLRPCRETVELINTRLRSIVGACRHSTAHANEPRQTVINRGRQTEPPRPPTANPVRLKRGPVEETDEPLLALPTVFLGRRNLQDIAELLMHHLGSFEKIVPSREEDDTSIGPRVSQRLRTRVQLSAN